MSEKERKEAKNKALLKARRREFVRNIDKLFQTEYRYSKRFEKNHIMPDGKAYINVDLTKVDTPFSVYSYDSRIDQEIYDYIENEANYLRADVPIVVNFDDGGRYTETLKDKIRRAVIRHYQLKYEDTRKTLERNTFSAWVILAIGIVIMAFSIAMGLVASNEYSLTLSNVFNVIKEVIVIAGWMFIWEAGDRFFFTGSTNREDVFNAGQLALLEVRFGEPVLPLAKDKYKQ